MGAKILSWAGQTNESVSAVFTIDLIYVWNSHRCAKKIPLIIKIYVLIFSSKNDFEVFS